jgi:hypothetical protein
MSQSGNRMKDPMMSQSNELTIEKTVWDDLPDSKNLKQKDEIEERAKQGTLIVKEGTKRYRPVEVPEVGWQLEPLSKS